MTEKKEFPATVIRRTTVFDRWFELVIKDTTGEEFNELHFRLTFKDIPDAEAKLEEYRDGCEKEKHGEWNYDMFDENYHCSECNRVGATIYNFCPNCGADMRTQNDRSWDTSERGVSGSVKNIIAQEEGEAE